MLIVVCIVCLKVKTTTIYKQCYSNDKVKEMIIFANVTDQTPKGFGLQFYPEFMKNSYPAKKGSNTNLANKQELMFP